MEEDEDAEARRAADKGARGRNNSKTISLGRTVWAEEVERGQVDTGMYCGREGRDVGIASVTNYVNRRDIGG